MHAFLLEQHTRTAGYVSTIRICLHETAVQFYRHCKGIRKEWRRGSFKKHGQLPHDDLGGKTNTANENTGILTQAIKIEPRNDNN